MHATPTTSATKIPGQVVEIALDITSPTDPLRPFADCLDRVDLLAEYTIFPGERGRYDGPPELCYPDEDPECEILALWIRQDVSPDIELTGKLRAAVLLAHGATIRKACFEDDTNNQIETAMCCGEEW